MSKRSLGKITFKNNSGQILDDGCSILEQKTNIIHNSLQDWMRVIDLREKGLLLEKENIDDVIFTMDDDVFDDIPYFFS